MNKLFRFPLSRWLAVLLLPVCVLLFFNKMAFSNLILARGDTFLYFYPYWQMAAEALQAGRLPLWNPHIFMGVPFLANSQVGFFYPLNWPLWWWLPVPYAVSATILLHLVVAGWGAYLAGRRCLALGRSAALVTAVLFCLGGYLTAQVEHVNQIQGLAWLPWFLVVLAGGASDGGKWVVYPGTILGLSLLFSLQLLAGHTQTTFITMVALAVWGVAHLVLPRLSRNGPYSLLFTFYGRRFRNQVIPALVLAGLLALLVAAVQLWPTLTLVQQSSRQGGLAVNEVLSFSLHPLLLSQALLPGYGRLLFSEYTAFLPITVLVLAVIGAWQWRQWRGVLPALCLTVVGLALSLGVFNPLYWLLARLPGFNLFRVPARWLVLYALGVALLAGLGWQIVWDRWLINSRDWHDLPARTQQNLWHIERPLRWALLVVFGLIIWSAVATIASIFVATGPESPYESPQPWVVGLWLVELVLVYLWLSGQRPQFRWPIFLRLIPGRPGPPWWLLLWAFLALFWSSRSQPYHNLTTPEAYFDLRPSLARLQAVSGCGEVFCQPARFLSLSNIFFDPGDQAEIDMIYGDQLPVAAQYDYTIAVKQKEIVSPNLPMAYGLASVDGFDGGILPLHSYSQLIQVILPEGTVTTDGRLRELLPAVPEADWLDLFHARYLITDKVGDAWREGVFFDLQHPVVLTETAVVGYVPPFAATHVWLVADAPAFRLQLETTVGHSWHLTPTLRGDDLYEVTLPEPVTLTHMALVSWPLCAASAVLLCSEQAPQVAGLSLVDVRDGAFRALVPGQYRLIHSGDVKIYENLDVADRVLLLSDWRWQSEVSGALEVMRGADFAVLETAVLVGDSALWPQPSGEGTGQAVIVEETAERIVVETSSDGEALLLLTDAYYPGWQATVDEQPVVVHEADVLFRAVFVPPGQHEVVFWFDGGGYENGRLLTFVGLLLWGGMAGVYLMGLWREG